MIITKNEAVEYLKDGLPVYFEVDDYAYEIASANDFIGGEDLPEEYISTAIGNVSYTSAEEVVEATYKLLSEDGKDVIVKLV